MKNKLKDRRGDPFLAFMMTTMHLSETETRNYRGATRADLRFRTAELAYSRGSRFWQIVGSNGRILDVGEVSLSLDTAAE